MSVRFERPTPENLDFIAARMRRADVVEVMAAGRRSPREAVLKSVELSDRCSVALINGEPCAVFGLVIANVVTGWGVPWLLGTDLIDRHKKLFVEHTRTGVREMLEICPILINYVHAENLKSIRWLKTMGFTVEAAEPFGVDGELFHKFHLESENV